VRSLYFPQMGLGRTVTSMNRVPRSVRQIWKETRGSIFVEALKYIGGATLLKSIGSAIWRLFTRAPVYWRLLLAEFFVGLFALAAAILLQRARRRPGASEDQESMVVQVGSAAPRSKPPHGIFFSPLQIEVMELIRGLKGLLLNAGPAPDFVALQDNHDLSDLQDRLTKWNRLLREWSTKIEARYKLYFAKQTEEVRLRINVMGLARPTEIEAALHSLEAIPGRGVKSSEEVKSLIEALQTLFMFLDGQTGESVTAQKAESA
jgi:hypothetical protein